MAEYKIIVKQGGGSMPSAQRIPYWFLDEEAVGPCPCGRPPNGPTFIYEGDHNLKRWFHRSCMGFLQYELDEEEWERFLEWKNHAEED